MLLKQGSLDFLEIIFVFHQLLSAVSEFAIR